MGLQERLAGLQEGAGTSGQRGDNVAEGGDAGKADEAEKTKLRQRIAALEHDAQEAVPYVNAVHALAGSEVGKQIIDRLKKGEDLTTYQLKKLEKAAEKEGAPEEGTPLTMEALEGKLAESEERTAKRVGETLRAQDDAKGANDRLEKWAGDKFLGYTKVRGSKVWNETMAGIIELIRSNTIKVPAGTDPWEKVIERTYHTVVSEDPEILKGEQLSTSEEKDRLSSILAAGNKASASRAGESDDDIGDVAGGYYKRSLDFAKTRGSGAIAGRSYANRGANKKG